MDKLFHLLLYLYLFALNLLVTHYFISIDSPLYQILRLKRDDWTKWTDEASGAYIQYSSIAEEGSVSLIKSTFANAPSLCKLWNKSHIANRTSFHLFSWCINLNVQMYLSIGKNRTSLRRDFDKNYLINNQSSSTLFIKSSL